MHHNLLYAGALLTACLLPQSAASAPMTVDDCVALALAQSAQIAESSARVAQMAGRLAEAESIFYPKLTGMAFMTPMYTVRGDIFDYEIKWQNIRDWGPYTHLQAVLAQPIYTFGRASAGKEAATAQLQVEKARLREAENVVALEVRRLYYTHLYAISLMPSLQFAKRTVDNALERAQELFEAGTGEVTQTDMSRLQYAQTEVRRFTRMAEQGAEISLLALKHTMGMPATESLELADTRLPNVTPELPASLPNLLQEAAEQRPEWAQLHQGSKAALALESAERLANAPVAFLAGQIEVNWAPTRDVALNPYHFDRFNRMFGGIALGLQFDLDPARAQARVQQAVGLQEEVEALRRFAGTGIPLQVRRAYSDLSLARQLVDNAREAEAATRRWMTFAGSAYQAGTGDARDLLEGVVAYVQSRRGQYESLRDFHIATAELYYAVGRR